MEAVISGQGGVALLVDGEIAGTWRRDQSRVTVSVWRALTRAQIAAVEAEASALPLGGLATRISLSWA